MELHAFRTHVIDLLRADRQALPEAGLHLLYLSELHDPLNLDGDARRLGATLHPAGRGPADPSGSERHPRLITLDCRRVAAYLFENDSALDDPLFEASITQAHAEHHLDQRLDTALENKDPRAAGVSIGGWLLSAQPAAAIARRWRAGSVSPPGSGPGERVRWHDPVHLSALWPTLSREQRTALLGDAIWFSFDSRGRLRRYAADRSDPLPDTPRRFPLLRPEQSAILRNAPLVRDLLAAWQEMDADLPDDAEDRLHRHVAAAQRLGLDAESVAIHALVVVQLKPGAADDAEWLALCRDAAERGEVLRDRLDALSDRFWERWLPHGSGNAGSPA